MAEENKVEIDKNTFHERLGQFVAAWKSDKRSENALFGGVGSIAIILGKADDVPYQKSNAMHVSEALEKISTY
jgi:nucleosome binding factor SPN SPT16 subunit